MEQLQNDTKSLASVANTYLKTIKHEEQRLAVRLLAVDRCARLVKYASEQADVSQSEEENEFEEIIANVEAVRYDLTTYLRQLHDRIAHIERGLGEAGTDGAANALLRYIAEDARLCARDLVVAREGYDDLIENLQAISHMHDQ